MSCILYFLLIDSKLVTHWKLQHHWISSSGDTWCNKCLCLIFPTVVASKTKGVYYPHVCNKDGQMTLTSCFASSVQEELWHHLMVVSRQALEVPCWDVLLEMEPLRWHLMLEFCWFLFVLFPLNNPPTIKQHMPYVNWMTDEDENKECLLLWTCMLILPPKTVVEHDSFFECLDNIVWSSFQVVVSCFIGVYVLVVRDLNIW